MSVEIFGLIGQKLVQTQSDKLKDEPTVSEAFLGIGNHTSFGNQTLIYKVYAIPRKYYVAVLLAAHDHARALLTRGRIPRCRTRKTDKRCAVIGVG